MEIRPLIGLNRVVKPCKSKDLPEMRSDVLIKVHQDDFNNYSVQTPEMSFIKITARPQVT